MTARVIEGSWDAAVTAVEMVALGHALDDEGL